MAWEPSADFEQTMGHALDLSLGKWRDELTRTTAGLRPDLLRRGIHGGAEAKHVWSSVWGPALQGLPERAVAVVIELFEAHRARLNKGSAAWLSAVIETRFAQLTEGLLKESAAEFPPSGFRHLLPDYMQRLAIQARAEINRRYDLVRFKGEGRTDSNVPDALTYEAFKQDATELLAGGELLAVLFCDMDRFKEFNDTLGHLAADEALRSFARAIKEVLGERGRVYRRSGDEFLVLAEGLDRGGAVRLMEEIQAGAGSVAFGFSGGSACHPTDGRTVQELEAAADVGMREDKTRRGHGR